MCTNHQRDPLLVPAPTITRVALAPIVRPARWTRRQLLVNGGLGTASIAILAACGSDSTTPASPSTTATPATTAAPTTAAGASNTTEAAAADAEPATDDGAAASADELQMQHVWLGFVSAYVLTRGNEAAIVDTGTAGSGEAITAALTGLGLEPSAVRHIVLTHDHGDHAGGLGELESAMTNATVYAGAGDVDSIRTSLPLSEVGDGDEVFGMGIVNTPGHTVGSISTFDTDTGLLIAGDAINGDGSGGITGANPSFTEDMDEANASIQKMAALAPQIAAFGHGGEPVREDVAAKLGAL